MRRNCHFTLSPVMLLDCRGKLNTLLPESGFGPNLNFIGLKTQDWVSSPLDWVLEKPPTPISPTDLCTAQKLTRARRLVQPPNAAAPVGVCAPSSSTIPKRHLSL